MQITFLTSLQQIPASAWNALCPSDYPFIRHEFLAALETSDCASAAKGWQPQHVIVQENGQVIAVLPLYLKSHSYGEYVFDWAWADAYKRNGLAYYPKLISAIPFTPCAGPRLLIADNNRRSTLIELIVAAIKTRALELQASSWHCLFPGETLSAELTLSGSAQRIGCQFHWFNRNYTHWDDFVASMTSRKRKNINKERRSVAQQGIRFLVKEGGDIAGEDWALFYQLYRNTYLKRSGHSGYLNHSFFTLLGEHASQALVMIIAQQREQPIAAALYFKDTATLYGRYWGCLEEYDFLHFETCYYQGIDYAIAQGLQRFDGGAQGEHKIQRGFEPIITYSNHWLARDDFQQAIDDFTAREAPAIVAYQEDAKQHLPFKETQIAE